MKLSPENRRRGMQADGEQLLELRKQAGLTQEKLAIDADVSERVIRKAENGGIVDASTLRSIAQALSEHGVPVETADLQSAVVEHLPPLVRTYVAAITGEAPPEALKDILGDSAELHVTEAKHSGPKTIVDWLRQKLRERQITYHTINTVANDNNVAILLRCSPAEGQSFEQVHWLRCKFGKIQHITIR